jgi:signal transduction histidine kinase
VLFQIVRWVAVVLRGAVPVVASGLVLAGGAGTGGARLWWLAALVSGWALAFGGYALRRGLTARLLAIDWVVALASVAAVGQLTNQLPDTAARGPAGEWAAVLASMSVIVVQLAWPARVSVPLGLVTALAFAVVGPDHGAHAAVLVLQTASAALVIAFGRRASRAAQAALDDYHATGRIAAVEQARRADERAQARRLHDTALATLTMVAGGAIADRSTVLRTRAAADQRVISQLGAPPRGGAGPAMRLDERLAEVVAEHPQLTVTVSVAAPADPVTGPRAEAVADAVGEALANVARHAGVAEVEIRVRVEGRQLVVEVADRGRGFVPETVPEHRFGIRESIVARMREVGGAAEVRSVPGHGTTIRLRCPDE